MLIPLAKKSGSYCIYDTFPGWFQRNLDLNRFLAHLDYLQTLMADLTGIQYFMN